MSLALIGNVSASKSPEWKANVVRDISDKETRRKALAFAVDADYGKSMPVLGLQRNKRMLDFQKSGEYASKIANKRLLDLHANPEIMLF